LVALSDKLTILVAVPGILVAALYVAAMRRNLSPPILVCTTSFWAAAAIAYFAGDSLWNRIVEITPAKRNFDPMRFKRQVGLLLDSLLTRRAPAEDIESVGVIMPQSHEWHGMSDLIMNLHPVQTAGSSVAVLFALTLGFHYFRCAARSL